VTLEYKPNKFSLDGLTQIFCEIWFKELHILLEENNYTIECKYKPVSYKVINPSGKSIILDSDLYNKLYEVSKKGIVLKQLAIEIIKDEFTQRDS